MPGVRSVGIKPVGVRPVWLKLGIVCVLAMGSLVGCSGGSGDNSADASFCDQAWQFLKFEARIGEVAGDSSDMEDFMDEWIRRLTDLSEVVPEAALGEVSVMKAGAEDLDWRLAEVSYDLLSIPVDNIVGFEVDEASARFRQILDDECQLGSDGVGRLVPTPDPLRKDELEELIDPEIDPETVEDELRADIGAQLGLTENESACLAAEIGIDELEQLVSGEVNEEAGVKLLAALDRCGIEL